MIIPCPRCQTGVPAEAAFCPRCGLPRAQFPPGWPMAQPPPAGGAGAALLGGAAVGEGGAAPSAPAMPAMPFGPQGVSPSVPSMGAGPQAAAPNVPSVPAGPQMPGAPGGPGMPPGPQGWPPAGAPPPGHPLPQQAGGWPGAQHPGMAHMAPPGAHPLAGAQHLAGGAGQVGQFGQGAGQLAQGAGQAGANLGQGAGQIAGGAGHAMQQASQAAGGHLAAHAAQQGGGLAHSAVAATMAGKAGRFGLRQLVGLLRRSLVAKIVAGVLAVTVVAGVGLGYYVYRSTAPTSFVIATDRGKGEIDRIDLASRTITVLLSNTAIKSAPDSAVFLSDTQILMDFVGSGDIGLGDIQAHTYTTISQNHGTLRDMAVRPDNSGVLIAEQDSGTILEYRVDNRSIGTFVKNQNLGGVQGLAFDTDGNLYAAVGGTIYQLDPTNGREVTSFDLQAGSDGMAYDKSRKTLDIASGDKILALDPRTKKITTLIEGVGETDGVAIDRRGNLFIAASIGVLELTTDNQLLIVGTNSNGVTWDDVAPLSGAGAANY